MCDCRIHAILRDVHGNPEYFGRATYTVPRTLFRQVAARDGGCEDVCVAFELTSKWNRVVVQHADPTLTMIGVRCRRTGRESPVSSLAHVYRHVRSFPLQSLADITATFQHLEPLKQEGYVVVDGFGGLHRYGSARKPGPLPYQTIDRWRSIVVQAGTFLSVRNDGFPVRS